MAINIYLNGNPFTNEYDIFDVIAKSSITTLMKVIPAALLLLQIFNICGIFTKMRLIKQILRIIKIKWYHEIQLDHLFCKLKISIPIMDPAIIPNPSPLLRAIFRHVSAKNIYAGESFRP